MRLALFAVGLALAATSCSSPPKPPNVVLIFVDDLGAGEVGCYGQEHIRTPHIDSIAQQGVRFTNAYAGSPVCAPSRCVLLTGKHSGHAAVRANWENGGWGEDQPEGQWPLPASEITLGERLQDLGYRTAGFGKWGLGGPDTEGAPEHQGFDHFYGYLCQRTAHNYYPTHLWRDGVKVPIDGAEYYSAHQKLAAPLENDDAYYERFGGAREGYAPALIADDMIEWLDDSAGKSEPFFLYYASLIPHVALQAQREDIEQYPAAWDSAAYLGTNSYLPHASPRRAYAAMITYMDEQVGRILETLEKNGQLENTIVIFTSDNGATYVGGVDTEFFRSHDGRRGHKGQLYEGGIRVPFVVQFPGHVPAGTVSNHLVSTVDVTSTVLDIVGAPAAGGLDSESFVQAMEIGDAARERPFLYWEYRPDGAQAVREGPWKLLRRGLKRGEPRLELYNIGSDRAETTDVAAEHPEIVERLALLMDFSHEPSEGFPLPTIDGDAKEIMARKTAP